MPSYAEYVFDRPQLDRAQPAPGLLDMNDVVKLAVVVCALAVTALTFLTGGLSTIIGSEVGVRDSDPVTANAVGAPAVAARTAQEVSGRLGDRNAGDPRLARSEPDAVLEAPEEVTLRASLEPVIEALALEESTVSVDADDSDDPEVITLRASLEPVLEDVQP